MSDKDVEGVMKLAFCSEEDARDALSKTHDVIDAVDMLLNIPPTRGAPKQKTMDETQLFFAKLRATNETINKSIEDGLQHRKGPTMSDQHESEVSVCLPTLHEETVQQSSYSQVCLPPSPESAAQIPETVYQLPSECSYDWQSNDQTQFCSDPQYHQLYPVRGMELSQRVWETPVLDHADEMYQVHQIVNRSVDQ